MFELWPGTLWCVLVQATWLALKHTTMSLAKAQTQCTLTVSLSTQVYKWLPVNLVLGIAR